MLLYPEGGLVTTIFIDSLLQVSTSLEYPFLVFPHFQHYSLFLKLLEENIGNKLFDIGLSNIFWDMSLWARETKEKMKKWDHIKLKFCTVKETINK